MRKMISPPAQTKEVFFRGEDINRLKQVRAEVTEARKRLRPDCAAIIQRVESLRGYLEGSAARKESLTDPEVLAASQALDEALNELYRVCSAHYEE